MSMQPARSAKRVRIAAVGAAFAANKGAAAMLGVISDAVPEHLGRCDVFVLTAYPREDRAWGRRAGAHVVPWRPLSMVLGLPLCLAAAAARAVGLPYGWLCRTPALKALYDADLVADVSGISFADGRGFPTLAYNVLVTATPLLLGRPTVKVSQALGPFRTPLNRLAARVVLPRLAAICARGSATERNLADLGLSNVTAAADLAFLLETPPEVRERAAAVIDERVRGPGPIVAVMPSQVVAAYCRRAGIDYPAIVAEAINTLVERHQARVLVLPHAWRPNMRPGRMNDRRVCAAVHDRVIARERVALLDADLSPQELRAFLGLADLAITSRFHGMISALCEETPPVVIGWSHKYREVLDVFGLGDQVLAYDDLSAGALITRAEHTLANDQQVRARIRAALPAVKDSAHRSLACLADCVRPAASRRRGPTRNGSGRDPLAAV